MSTGCGNVGSYASSPSELSLQEGPEYPGYPESAAVFVLSPYTDWDRTYVSKWHPNIIKTMVFNSVSKGSVLTRFELIGLTDGSVRLMLFFSTLFPCYDAFEKYLKEYGFSSKEDLDFRDGRKCCISRDHNEMKTLFEIISTHNTIPVENLEKVRGIVERGNWDRMSYLLEKKYVDYWKRGSCANLSNYG